MKVGITKERRRDEERVAASPDTVRKMVQAGLEVVVETGAGLGSSMTDAAYEAAGAAIAADPRSALEDADIVLKVQPPLMEGEGDVDELSLVKSGALLVGMLAPYRDRERVELYAKGGISAFALELLPRISRAQGMDALSSQSNLSGYMAILDAAAALGRALPMMMTAAGTIPAARAFILGAGVAGLQAIATARRLGARVSATDVRPAAREQVESLGATFVMVEDEETKTAETATGYAREMSDDYRRRQAALVAETLAVQDIAVSTALVPGRPAPTLIDEEMVRSMKPGSVIVDLAAPEGGNCTLSRPDEIVEVEGVKIIAHLNNPSRVPTTASAMYANNLFNFLAPLIKDEGRAIEIDFEDEIISGTLLTRDGTLVHPLFAKEAG